MDICEKCGLEISDKVSKYSKDNFGSYLCMSCQIDTKKSVEKIKEGINEVKSQRPVEEYEKKNSSKVEGIQDKHIIKLAGKEFITFAGLLEKAHEVGLSCIKTELISQSEDLVVFKALVEMKDGQKFEAHGDASKNNVNQMIVPHKLRMAETRSIARALRLATNIGMCSLEELGEVEQS